MIALLIKTTIIRIGKKMEPGIFAWCSRKIVISTLIAFMFCHNAIAGINDGQTDNTRYSSTMQSRSSSYYSEAEEPDIDPLTILDTSELIIDGASTLVVTFSSPLNRKQDLGNLVTLTEKGNKVDGAWELSDSGLELRHRYLSPNRKLVLTIDRNILAVNGSQLDEPYTLELKTRKRDPIVGFAGKGFVLPSQSKTGLPVMTLNVDKVDINFYRIKKDKLDSFLRRYSNINQFSLWNSTEILEYTDLAYTGRFNLNPERDVQENVLLDLSKISEFKKEGVYVAVMSEAGLYKYRHPVTVFSISNIGVSIHVYPEGGFSAFTQALDTGKPLSNVKIYALNSDEITRDDDDYYESEDDNDDNDDDTEVTVTSDVYDELGKTSQMGILSSSADLSKYRILLVTDGTQTSFFELGRNALDLSEFGITGTPFYNKQIFTFSARDLYRPGETIDMNVLLRDADGQALPEQPIKVKIFKPSGNEATEFILKPVDGNVGFYQTQYAIPLDAETGKWSFGFNLGDDEYRRSYFSVEEFLPERMAMEITKPNEGPILNDGNLAFDIKGRYLYGTPAANNEIQGNLFLKVQRKIDGLNGFIVGSLNDTSLARHLSEVKDNLNKDGETTIPVDSSYWSSIKSPVEIAFQASLMDVGGRPVTRTVRQTIWPAKSIPAIRPLFDDREYYDWYSDRYVTRPTVDEGSMAQFEIAYIDINGKKVANDSLTARVIKERKDYYWTWSNRDGWQVKYNEKEFVVSQERLAVRDNDVAIFGFLADGWGSYRVEIIDQSSQVVSSMRVWSGYEWGDNTNGTGSIRPDQVKLSINKLSYKPGDTAIVHVEAPAAGKGYLSVESNEGILWSKNIEVPTGGLDVKVPISDWKRHDIYLSSVIVRPSQKASVQTIKRAVGLLYLPVGIENRELNLSIEAPDKIQPEEIVKIKVKVDNAKLKGKEDREITVLMSAVDSGVLNITNFVTPDPFTAFLGKKRYNTDHYDMYGKLIEGQGRLVSMNFGGDSDEDFNDLSRGGKKPVSQVKIVAQQLRTIKLDENGEGEFELPMPKFYGEIRLMAQAWDESRFGRAEEVITVSSTLVVELATPRFLSSGDESILALQLHNLSKRQQQLTVTVKSDGLLTLENEQPLSLTLADNERHVLQIPVKAGYGYGQGEISLNIDGLVTPESDNAQINNSWVIGVRPSYAAESRSYYFVLGPKQGWTIPEAALIDLIPNTVSAKIAISNKPPLNITQYIESLFAYPYGCLEQTTSGLYPSLYANQKQMAELGIKTESDEKRRRKIEIGIDRILGMQLNNGGFGLWTKESREEYWLTVYATDFLLRAKERGYSVNSKALDKALARIGEYLYDNQAFYNAYDYASEYKNYQIFATKAYAALVLSQQNKFTPAVRNGLTRLYTQAKNNNDGILKSALPLVQLAIAYKNAGYGNESEEIMKLALRTKRDTSNYWLGDYGSDIRDKALMVSLLAENNLSPQSQGEYLLELTNDLKDKRYLSTQELNSLFLAGWQLHNPKEEKELWSIGVNGNEISSAKPLMKSYGYKSLNSGVTLKNPSSDTPLYVKFDISGYTENRPKPTPKDSTLKIRRFYYDVKGKQTSIENMTVGDLVVVVLEVSTDRSIYDALVVDLLPAGLELENQNLANSSINISSLPEINDLLKGENPSDIQYQEYRDDRFVASINVGYGTSCNNYRKHIVYLARAVTSGTYIVPSPYVESMYNPNWFAIGESIDKMTISDKKPDGY